MSIEELLKMHSPTEIEKMLEAACPLYVPRDTVFSGIYAPVHALANNMLAVELQSRLKIAYETEQNLSEIRGRLDARVVTTYRGLSVEVEKKTVAIIEMKTGALKLVQPACYAYNQRCPVIIAGIKTNDVLIVTPETAEKILKSVVVFLEKKEALKASSTVIRDGIMCKRCASETCGFAGGVKKESVARPQLYEETVEILCSNLQPVVEKVVEVLKQICGEASNGN